MKSLLRLRSDGRFEWLDRPTARPVVGAASDVPEELRNGATVLVPGEDVLVAVVEVAARQRHRLLQAIPYAVEDQLIDEIDRHHFALGDTVSEHRHLVAAVAHERMRQWQELLEDAGVTPAALRPDTLAVAPSDGEAVLLLDGERVLLRHGAGTAVAAGREEADGYLQLLEVEGVRVVGSGNAPILSLPASRADEATPALSALAGAAWSKPTVDLLQGAYALRPATEARSRGLWLAAGLLVVFALVAETTGRALAVWSANREAATLEAQAGTILTTRFPGIRRVVDARVQMQQAIDALRGGSGAGGVLSLLRLAGPALAGDGTVRVDSVNFRQGSLLVAVEADDLRRIEAMRQRLVGLELDARIESANTLEDRATARLRIGGAP